MKKIYFLWSLLRLLSLHLGWAQTNITGTVNDETSPLLGVTIIETGTNNGVTADFDGMLSITIQTGEQFDTCD